MRTGARCGVQTSSRTCKRPSFLRKTLITSPNTPMRCYSYRTCYRMLISSSINVKTFGPTEKIVVFGLSFDKHDWNNLNDDLQVANTSENAEIVRLYLLIPGEALKQHS